MTVLDPEQACAREPIHIPGAIQPHGFLLTFEEAGQRILQVSTNAEPLLGQPAGHWAGRSLAAALGLAGAQAVQEALRPAVPDSPVPLLLPSGAYDGVLHRTEGVAVLELEPAVPESPTAVARHHHALSLMIGELQRAEGLAALSQAAAQAVAQLTGFDRVMVYRFHRDWHGEVIAEVKADDMEPYLGLHYPASDIPEQARKLYERNWLRLIVASSYTAVPLQPVLNPHTGAPLDLSQSVWRSVSPIHLQYLRNMGVGASMSISLLRDGQLWGLIACHHRTPRALSFVQRAAGQLIGQCASIQIAVQEGVTRQSARLAARSIQAQFFEHLARSTRFVEALVRYTPELLKVLGATGAAIVVHDRCELLGETPREAEVRAVLAALAATSPEPLLVHDSLRLLDSRFDAFRRQASGALALALSELRTDWILWFRPEVATTVTWAGRPTKEVEAETQRLTPRTSFAAWEETVLGRAQEWTEVERSAALELRTAIGANILKRYDRLRDQNVELEKKNSDLDSFAYIAAHDLKEPLRGMRNYAEFVLEDNVQTLPEEDQRKLRTVVRLGDRLRDQLDDLLTFSRLGRKELERAPVSLATVLQETLELLTSRLEEEKPELTVAPDLPRVLADGPMLREVLLNLITNALKYNLSPQKEIEIGSREAAEGGMTEIFVRDNGIGISPDQQDEVFRIFRRLHGRDDFGGGTGAGLAIVKSVVERHGGVVGVESAPGVGSTFFFTLPRELSDSHASHASAA